PGPDGSKAPGVSRTANQRPTHKLATWGLRRAEVDFRTAPTRGLCRNGGGHVVFKPKLHRVRLVSCSGHALSPHLGIRRRVRRKTDNFVAKWMAPALLAKYSEFT